METISQLISTMGFPIVMCLLMFFSQNKKLDALTTSINNLTNVVAILNKKVEVDEDKKEDDNNE